MSRILSICHSCGYSRERGKDPCDYINTGALEFDNNIYSTDIEEFNLSVQLVTLSSCESGGGLSSNTGMLGPTRAFFQAGAKAVLSSLWKVDNDSTTDFMVSFYKHLRAGERKSSALQKAMIETKRIYSSPKYWASFFLTGSNSQIRWHTEYNPL